MLALDCTLYCCLFSVSCFEGFSFCVMNENFKKTKKTTLLIEYCAYTSNEQRNRNISQHCTVNAFSHRWNFSNIFRVFANQISYANNPICNKIAHFPWISCFFSQSLHTSVTEFPENLHWATGTWRITIFCELPKLRFKAINCASV